MNKIKKGDTVTRISYGKDILFRVEKITKGKNGRKKAILKGITERIVACSYLDDLCIIEKKELDKKLKELDKKYNKRMLNNKYFGIYENKRIKKIDLTGKILHIDGDKKYSEKSYRYYKKMRLNAIVKNIAEYRQPRQIYRLLQYYQPDIVVITGHDGMIRAETGYNDIYNYRNSKYFIQTVKEVRRYDRNYNKNTVVFAGACQSYYEALIMAGANFASSPARILIDFLDPIIVAENIALTDYYRYITIDDISKELRDGKKGISGIGANGKKLPKGMVK